jgi:hypothetical protein
MAKFLFTMIPANDLGLPTRMVPIARALADRSHQVPCPMHPFRLCSPRGIRICPRNFGVLPSVYPRPIDGKALRSYGASWRS